jgi:hypothetical protein
VFGQPINFLAVTRRTPPCLTGNGPTCPGGRVSFAHVPIHKSHQLTADHARWHATDSELVRGPQPSVVDPIRSPWRLGPRLCCQPVTVGPVLPLQLTGTGSHQNHTGSPTTKRSRSPNEAVGSRRIKTTENPPTSSISNSKFPNPPPATTSTTTTTTGSRRRR